MTNGTKTDWYSIRAEYKPISPEQRLGRGEWYLQITLIHERSNPSGKVQTEKKPLGTIDVDHIDSVELRKAFCESTKASLDVLNLPHETRELIAAELRLVVRPPSEDMSKAPRIGFGALIPDNSNSK